MMALRLRTAPSSEVQQSEGADDLADTTGAICRCWVYDFDTRLDLPCPAESESFRMVIECGRATHLESS